MFRDRDNGIAETGAHAFKENIKPPDRKRLTIIETPAVHGMNYHFDAGQPRGQPPDDPRFRTVGVHNLYPAAAHQERQLENRAKVFQRMHRPDEEADLLRNNPFKQRESAAEDPGRSGQPRAKLPLVYRPADTKS